MASLRCSIAKLSKDLEECGSHPSMPGVEEYCGLSSCSKDVTAHLRQYKASSKGVNFEWQVILARVGKFEVLNLEKCPAQLTVCPLHRANLGIYWKPKHNCQHPQHKTKAKAIRGVTFDVSRSLQKQFGILIPIGSSKFVIKDAYAKNKTSKNKYLCIIFCKYYLFQTDINIIPYCVRAIFTFDSC